MKNFYQIKISILNLWEINWSIKVPYNDFLLQNPSLKCSNIYWILPPLLYVVCSTMSGSDLCILWGQLHNWNWKLSEATLFHINSALCNSPPAHATDGPGTTRYRTFENILGYTYYVLITTGAPSELLATSETRWLYTACWWWSRPGKILCKRHFP